MLVSDGTERRSVALCDRRAKPLGFTAAEPAADEGAHAGRGQGRVPARVLNRIDEIVTFRALTAEQVEAICELMVAAVAGRLREERGIGLDFDPELLRRPATERFDPE